MGKNKQESNNERHADNTPMPIETGLKRVDGEELMIVDNGGLPAAPDRSLARNAETAPGEPRRVTEIEREIDEGHMGGGYASVKGRVHSENRLIWIVLVVMTIMCIVVGVCSSVLTGYFMRRGSTPAGINSEGAQQAVAAVVSARKSSVVEVASGSTHGSGVVMKLSNSKIYIITNAHVINGAMTPSVRFYGENNYYEAVTLGYSSYYDIAVISVAHKTTYEVYDLDGSEYFSPDTEYADGDYVVAIGNAMSMGIAVYDGIISRSGELLKYEDKTVPVLRTTAAINAGMSGGALFDMSGRFIGLGTYRMSSMANAGEDESHAKDVEDTGFATPVPIVYSVYKHILEFGDGGDIGMPSLEFYKTNTSAVGAVIFRDFGFTCEYRNGKLTVVSLDANNAPAAIREKDVIVSIGTTAVSSDVCRMCGEFLRYRRNSSGAPLKLTINRGGVETTVTFDGYNRYVE